MGGPLVNENPRNEYGTERFICRALMPNAGVSQWDPHQGRVVTYGSGAGTAVLYDRRRSVMVRLGPQEAGKALLQGIVIPFHEAGYRQFAEVVKKRGIQGQLLYVWVRRVGDCVEVEWVFHFGAGARLSFLFHSLKDIPVQNDFQWD